MPVSGNYNGNWLPISPEPYWFRDWLGRLKIPGCYECKIKFKTRQEHSDHWVSVHMDEQPEK